MPKAELRLTRRVRGSACERENISSPEAKVGSYAHPHGRGSIRQAATDPIRSDHVTAGIASEATLPNDHQVDGTAQARPAEPRGIAIECAMEPISLPEG